MSRYEDISAMTRLVELTVLSDRYNATDAPLDAQDVPEHTPDDFDPEVAFTAEDTPDADTCCS